MISLSLQAVTSAHFAVSLLVQVINPGDLSSLEFPQTLAALFKILLNM